MKNFKSIFGLRNTRGTTDPFTITSTKNHEKWKTSDRFLGWGTRGGQLVPSRSPSQIPWKMKNFRRFLGWGTRWGTADPFTITITNTMENEKFQMIFGLRYTRGSADPFTITILKTMKTWKISDNFWVDVHARVQLIPSRSPAKKPWKMKNFKSIFGLRNTRGTTYPFTITSLKTMKNEKLQIDFWVEVHAGNSWSLHDHHH